MHDRNLTIHLLEYYSELAAHHRIMMVGFATFYIGINQALLLTPIQIIQAGSGKNPLALVLSAGLLTTFVLAGAMHHACHFCATAGIRAVMAADIHYQHLPQEAAKMDTFVRWISGTASAARQSLAIRSFSVYIIGILFGGLAITNAYIFLETAKELLGTTNFNVVAIFTAFLVFQVAALLSYGWTFRKHFKHFQIAKKELAVVLESDTRSEVDHKIRKNNFRIPPSSGIADDYPLDQDRA